MTPRTIALEGPSLSGKTTLASRLIHQLPTDALVVCPDYVDFAGGPEKVPPTPRDSIAGELESFQFFLALDEARWTHFVDTAGVRAAILDRSIHTLLAHTLAIEYLTGRKIFESACAIAESRRAREPDLVLFFDLSDEELERRAQLRESYCDPLFKRRDYNRAFREYFVPRLRWGRSSIHAFESESEAEIVALVREHLRESV